MHPIALSILLLLPPQAEPGASKAAACDVAAFTDFGKLKSVLSMRLVDIFRRAHAPGWAKDAELTRLIDADAEFDLGAGDVGRPMGKGISGARKMLEETPISAFRYSLWTYIPRQVEPCTEQRVMVEFFDPATGDIARVEGKFNRGILMSAKGWMQAEVSGKF